MIRTPRVFPAGQANLNDLFRCESHFLKLQGVGSFLAKHPVDRDDVKMQMGVEQPAEAVDEDDGADAGFTTSFRQALPQALFDAVQKAVQHGVLSFGIVQKKP